jgi:hypothetical protein
VSRAVQALGTKATQAALTAAERHASVSVDPRYGVWAPDQAVISVPFTPETSDILNASANEAPLAPTSATTSPFSG